MSDRREVSRQQRWAVFRLGVISRLLSAPPPRGELRAALDALAEETWDHPITGAPRRFSRSTIERWLRRARAAPGDPLGALRQPVRSDEGGHPSVREAHRRYLRASHAKHPRWSYQLHYDNLVSAAEEDDTLVPLPSYSSARRYMRSAGLLRLRRKAPAESTAARAADHRRQRRETRSFEVERVGELWHTDYHCCSRKVLLADGSWARPWIVAFLDDHSRLVCHAQWYLKVSAAHTVHALGQAIGKRGLPWRLMHDNGKEFVAAEVQQGLQRLGISPEPTMAYSPEQNGKQERWWGQLEGRLLAMLDAAPELSLADLNLATQAWIEQEYHRTPHRELGETPLDRHHHGASVLRDAPDGKRLRIVFGQQEARRLRRSDGTISLGGARYELPVRFRHLAQVTVRWARWDLGFVHLVDPRTDAVLCRIFPLDKAANADGRRRSLEPREPADPPAADDGAIPPRLAELIAHYQRDGLPPAYLPKDELSAGVANDDDIEDDHHHHDMEPAR